MAKTNNERNTENNKSQELRGDLGNSKTVNPLKKPEESWEDYKARVWAKCHQSSPTSPDDIPFTLKELVLGLWNELETKLETDSFDEKLEKEYLLEQEELGELHFTEATRKELRKEPPTLADVVMKFLKSPPAIVESLQSIDSGQVDYTDQLDKIIELWTETNHYLGAIARHLEEPPEDTPQRSRPLKPLPVGGKGESPVEPPPTSQGSKYGKF